MQHKLEVLQKFVRERKLNALLIENPIDLFYLTGMSFSQGYLVVQESESTLFVDARYIEKAKKISFLPVVLNEKKAFMKGLSGVVGFDSAFMTYEEYSRLEKEFPEILWEAVPSPLKEMRRCKTPGEIAALRRAARLSYEGMLHIKGLLQEGISEEELAFAFEWFCRKKGASSLSFEPIIAFGPNSASPHHRAGKALLQKGQVVLMDVGAVVDHYHGDLTRISFFGEADPKLLYFFHVVKRAQQKAMQAVRPGVLIGHLDEIVRQEFRSEGLEELFTHSLGHGVGLETHESPRVRFDGEDADLALKPGMVITLEPGLYQPSLGGIRYEDMVLVTEDGHENLCGHVEF
jgi:Xaa-Pro aminopeptidase